MRSCGGPLPKDNIVEIRTLDDGSELLGALVNGLLHKGPQSHPLSLRLILHGAGVCDGDRIVGDSVALEDIAEFDRVS